MNSGFKLRYLIYPLLFILFIWWYIKRIKKEEFVSSGEMEIVVKKNKDVPISTSQAVPNQGSSLKVNVSDKPKRVDLTKIKGIGPKIASVLEKSGITNFNQLAAINTDDLSVILKNNNIRAGNIENWIEQAKQLI